MNSIEDETTKTLDENDKQNTEAGQDEDVKNDIEKASEDVSLTNNGSDENSSTTDEKSQCSSELVKTELETDLEAVKSDENSQDCSNLSETDGTTLDNDSEVEKPPVNSQMEIPSEDNNSFVPEVDEENIRYIPDAELDQIEQSLETGVPASVNNDLSDYIPKYVKDIYRGIINLESPDDLQVHSLALQMQKVQDESHYRWLCEEICKSGSTNREMASITAAVSREVANFRVGNTNLRRILFETAQNVFKQHENLSQKNHEQFVTSAVFLGEIYYYVRSIQGTPFTVIAHPLITILNKILLKHLNNLKNGNSLKTCMCKNCANCLSVSSISLKESQKTEVNGGDSSGMQLELCEFLENDVMVVAKQILHSGNSLIKVCPEGISEMIQMMTEVLCRSHLSALATIQVTAALSEMWPYLSVFVHPRTSHAILASRMGLSLNL